MAPTSTPVTVPTAVNRAAAVTKAPVITTPPLPESQASEEKGVEPKLPPSHKPYPNNHYSQHQPQYQQNRPAAPTYDKQCADYHSYYYPAASMDSSHTVHGHHPYEQRPGMPPHPPVPQCPSEPQYAHYSPVLEMKIHQYLAAPPQQPHYPPGPLTQYQETRFNVPAQEHYQHYQHYNQQHAYHNSSSVAPNSHRPYDKYASKSSGYGQNDENYRDHGFYRYSEQQYYSIQRDGGGRGFGYNCKNRGYPDRPRHDRFRNGTSYKYFDPSNSTIPTHFHSKAPELAFILVLSPFLDFQGEVSPKREVGENAQVKPRSASPDWEECTGEDSKPEEAKPESAHSKSQESALDSAQAEGKQDDLLALKNDIQKQLEEKLGLATLIDLDGSKPDRRTQSSDESSGDVDDSRESNESHKSNEETQRLLLQRTKKKKSRTSPTRGTTDVSSTGEDTDPAAANQESSKVKCNKPSDLTTGVWDIFYQYFLNI